MAGQYSEKHSGNTAGDIVTGKGRVQWELKRDRLTWLEQKNAME
jgi:hypothetical protein